MHGTIIPFIVLGVVISVVFAALILSASLNANQNMDAFAEMDEDEENT